MGSEPSPCCGSCQMIANASHWHLIYYAKTDPHTSQLLSPSPDVSVKEPRLRWGGRVPHTCNLVGTLDLVSSCLQLSTSHLVRMEGPQGGGGAAAADPQKCTCSDHGTDVPLWHRVAHSGEWLPFVTAVWLQVLATVTSRPSGRLTR